MINMKENSVKFRDMWLLSGHMCSHISSIQFRFEIKLNKKFFFLCKL